MIKSTQRNEYRFRTDDYSSLRFDRALRQIAFLSMVLSVGSEFALGQIADRTVGLDIANSQSIQPSPLSTDQIASLARQKSSAANILKAETHSRTLYDRYRTDECEAEILKPIQDALAYRSRQSSAADALKLHFGIAACLRAQGLIAHTMDLLETQQQAQTELVDRGVPIPDPLLIDRLLKTTEDKRLDNESKLSSLRIRLAAVIGSECACNHMPDEPEFLTPSDVDVCDHVRDALRCRCDLVTLKRLEHRICEETLECWEYVGALLSGVPAPMKKSSTLFRFLHKRWMGDELQAALNSRHRWLSLIIQERSKQIATEVELAFEKKKTSALRWVNANEQVTIWERRVAQLEEMGRVRGNLAEQFEAKLNRLQAEAMVIERWADWNLANIDLQLAVGCH